jgi:ribonuclease P protein component
MLNKNNRLNSKEIKGLLKKGKRKRWNAISLVYRKNNLKGHRLAVIVPKKIEKKAVKRNQLRRRFKEAMRLFFKDFKLKENYDMVLLVYAKDYDYKKASKEIERLFKETIN